MAAGASIVGVISAATVVVALAHAGGLAILLTLLQGLGLAFWFTLGAEHGRSWATANMVIGGAWVALFLIPSVVFAVAPHYLHPLSPAAGIGIVDVSLVAMIGGVLVERRGRVARATTRYLEVVSRAPSSRRAACWFVVGLAGLGLLMANAGGPKEYLGNLQGTASVNSGVFYVIAVALALQFGPVGLVFIQWSAGQAASRGALVAAAAGLALLLLTGARIFGAIGGVELLVAYALVRRRFPIKRLLPLVLIPALVLIFGVGAIKRHQNYNLQHPEDRLSLPTYAVRVAPHELVGAYVNNYVDTVRLMALARSVVPADAPYEGFRPLLTVVLKPIPGGIRPEISRNREITQAFDPGAGYAYSVPLQTTMYLAGGGAAVAFTFLLIGFAIASLDRWLAAPIQRSPATALLAIITAVQIPVLLRSGLPNGLAVLGTELVGTLVVTWHIAGGSPRGLLSRRHRAAPRAAS